nr:hypothetical protein [Proteus mirabilis]
MEECTTVDEKDAYLSRANDGSYDNGNWSREYEMVKVLPLDGLLNNKNMSLLISLTYCLERLFKATFYNDNQIVYNVAQTYLHSKKC